MKVLIVDCYDSFTFSLYQQVGKLGGNPVVMTCDTPLEELKKIGCDRIILSPGPGERFPRWGSVSGTRQSAQLTVVK
jgi:anthranilate synthase component 2